MDLQDTLYLIQPVNLGIKALLLPGSTGSGRVHVGNISVGHIPTARQLFGLRMRIELSGIILRIILFDTLFHSHADRHGSAKHEAVSLR